MRQGEAAGPVWALGAMSGTSLDGVDAAMLQTDGHRIHGFGLDGYRPYSDSERATLRAALGCWPGEAGVAAAAAVVEAAHAELLARFPQAEVVGFHGQTLAHEPGARGTHQAGCGQRLAEALGKPVVWDFRTADVALGGQGAPLAPFYHHACAQWMGATAPLAFLNLGGVANLTWVNPAVAAPELPGALLAFDAGPANAPMDDLMLSRHGRTHDEGGALAGTGKPDEALIARLLAHPYLHRMPPKSLDRMDFPELPTALVGLDDADALATAAGFAAACVATGMAHLPAPPSRVLVTGGGRLNPVLVRMIAERLPCPVDPVEVAGLNGDMLEAQAFAHLAVRVLRGLPTSCPGTTGVAAAVGGGQLSDPTDFRPLLGRA